MHRVIRGVDVQETDIGTVLKNIDGDLPQPIVYLATVYARRPTVALCPPRRWRLGGHGDLSTSSQKMNGFYFAGQQCRPYTGVRRPLNDCWDTNEIRAFHVVGLTGLFIEIRISRDAVFLGPSATTNRRIVGISYGWKNCTDPLKKTPRRHQVERGQRTRFKVIHTESIVHADDDALLSDEGHMHPPPRTIFFSPDGIKGCASIYTMKYKALTHVLH